MTDTGWVCPLCGRGVAPTEKVCDCRKPKDLSYYNTPSSGTPGCANINGKVTHTPNCEYWRCPGCATSLFQAAQGLPVQGHVINLPRDRPTAVYCPRVKPGHISQHDAPTGRHWVEKVYGPTYQTASPLDLDNSVDPRFPA